MRYGLLVMMVVMIHGFGSAQSVRSLINGGNERYGDKKFNDAEVDYRKALEQEQGLVQGHYNLGNALYKQNQYAEAVKEYESALHGAASKEVKSKSYYNIGNAHLKAREYDQAVKSYIESLKLNPSDEEAKYNLSYALEKLKQQQQNQKNDKDKDKQQKNKDENENRQQKNQDKKESDRQKQQQQQEKDQQQKQGSQQGAQQEKKMSKAEAERILNVLKNAEKDVQKKLRVRQGVRTKVDKDW